MFVCVRWVSVDVDQVIAAADMTQPSDQQIFFFFKETLGKTWCIYSKIPVLSSETFELDYLSFLQNPCSFSLLIYGMKFLLQQH